MKSPSIHSQFFNHSPFNSKMIQSQSPLIMINGDSLRESKSESIDHHSDGNCSDSSQTDRCGSRDSGIECAHEFLVPDSNLVKTIVESIESYFSDDNLLKDPFLQKHIRRNKEGYVSLKLVASFRKIKNLTKDWKVVAYSIKNGSSMLKLNFEETKVRRIMPILNTDGTSTADRTVIAYNLPPDHESVEAISKMFEMYEITLIRVLSPGGQTPNNLVALFNKYPVLEKSTIAVIEFCHKSDAEKVIKENSKTKLNHNWRTAIKMEIIPLKSAERPNGPKPISSVSLSSLMINRDESIRRQRYLQEKNRINIRKAHSEPLPVSDSNPNPLRTFNCMYQRQKSQSYSAGDERNDHHNPWSKPKVDVNLPRVEIIRHPYGPNGTKGFNALKKERSASEP